MLPTESDAASARAMNDAELDEVAAGLGIILVRRVFEPRLVTTGGLMADMMLAPFRMIGSAFSK